MLVGAFGGGAKGPCLVGADSVIVSHARSLSRR